MLTQTTNRVPQQIFTWALRQETWLHRRLQRAALRAAQAQAFARFAQAHPLWAESLFDEYFLSHAAAPLVARAIEPANRPTASEFAAAWFVQCAAPGSTAQGANLAEVTSAASEFLRYLDAALQPYQAIVR
jgi:invasion protein IalB